MADINRVFLSGRLARNPELKYTSSGTAYCKFDLAVDKMPRKGSNEREAIFFNRITIWDRQAEVFEQYVKQGDQVFIEGTLGINEWEKEGQKRRDVEITCRFFTFGAKKGGGSSGPQSNYGSSDSSRYPSERQPSRAPAPPVEPIEDDDIPF